MASRRCSPVHITAAHNALFAIAALLSGCPSPPKDPDIDGDGFVADDCAEGDANVYPGAHDEFGDGIDADCDGLDGTDADMDGVPAGDGPGLDCDDADAERPRDEVYNDLDDDCDGCVDDLLWTFAGGASGSTELLEVWWHPDGLREADEVRLGIVGPDEDGWTGEDCTAHARCHVLSGSLGLQRLEVVSSPEEVTPGRTTLFDRHSVLLATQVFLTPNEACTLYGADPSYYDEMGCCVPNDWAPW